MRLIAAFLLFMTFANILVIPLDSVASDQVELELLEEIPNDTENEFEDDAPFYISHIWHNPSPALSLIQVDLKMDKLADASNYAIPTPPPEG